MKRNIIKVLAASAMFAFGAASASAQVADDTNTATLGIRLTVKGGCTINFNLRDSGSGRGYIDFGNVAALDSDLSQTQAVGLSCRGPNLTGQTYAIALDDGQDPTGSQRRLVGFDDNTPVYVNYEVYKGLSRAGGRWGQGAGETFTGTIGAMTGSQGTFSASHDFTVFVPAQPDTPLFSSVYEDVLQATLTWEPAAVTN